MSQKLDILKKSPPFNLLPDDVLAGVEDLLVEVRYNKEATIYHQEITKMTGVDIIVKGQYEFFFYDSAQSKRSVEVHEQDY